MGRTTFVPRSLMKMRLYRTKGTNHDLKCESIKSKVGVKYEVDSEKRNARCG